MQAKTRQISTSTERRVEIIHAALVKFGDRGYYGTTTASIAAAAGLSQAYLYKIWPSKEALFIAVLDEVKIRLREAIMDTVDGLEAAGRPYSAGEVLRARSLRPGIDRNAAMVLVHATAAAAVPALRQAVADCYFDQVDFLRKQVGATDDEIQRYLAIGQLVNSVNALEPTPEERSTWADALRASTV
jgi:AcrR family transcriptional regulator